MANEDVNITIRILHEGSENAKKAKDSLNEVEKSTRTATAATDKQNTSLSLLTTNLSKEIPALRAITPIMSSLGMSALMSGAAVAGLGVVLMEASQSLEMMMAGIAQTGAITNQYTAGPMQSWADSYGETKKLADLFGITLGDVTESMGILTAVTRDDAVSQQILHSALGAHRATGRPLIDIVNELTQAYVGTNKVYDKTTGQMLMGMDAVRQLTADYLAQETEIGKLDTSMNDLSARGLEDLKVGFGLLGSILLLPFKLALGGIAQLEIGIGNLLKSPDMSSMMDILKILGSAGIGAGIGMAAFGPIGAILGGLLGGGLSALIPKFDEGGIVSHPTLALLAANNRPEAVTPLDSAGASRPINLYLPDGTLIAAWIMNQLDDKVRLRTAY